MTYHLTVSCLPSEMSPHPLPGPPPSPTQTILLSKSPLVSLSSTKLSVLKL